MWCVLSLILFGGNTVLPWCMTLVISGSKKPHAYLLVVKWVLRCAFRLSCFVHPCELNFDDLCFSDTCWVYNFSGQLMFLIRCVVRNCHHCNIAFVMNLIWSQLFLGLLFHALGFLPTNCFSSIVCQQNHHNERAGSSREMTHDHGSLFCA